VSARECHHSDGRRFRAFLLRISPPSPILPEPAMHPSVKKLAIKAGTKVKHAVTGERGTVRATSIYHIVVTLKDGSRAHWARKWVKKTRS
jgi:hypothetical protein